MQKEVMRGSRLNIFSIEIFTFCLILIQSIGIRFFSGQGIFISIIIIVLSFKNFKNLKINDLRFLFLALIMILISKNVNESFQLSGFVYQITIIISTYVFLIGYRGRLNYFQRDFFISLEIFVIHAIIGYCLCLILPGFFTHVNGTLNKSLYNLFYVSHSSFGAIQRNTGLFWEPGVFQLVANLYLFYCIKLKKKTSKILLGIVAVISSLSTSGLMILLINVTYFIYNKWREKRIKLINLIVVLSVIIVFIPIILGNTQDKVNEDNTSAIVRLRDYHVGLDLIKEKPILGHGVFDYEYLLSKPYVKKWESNLFTTEYLDISDEMSGGYTNGLLGLIAWFGIPVSFLMYFFYFKNRFIDGGSIERILFNLIFLFSLISEPISYTSLFLMFPFSYWIFNKRKRINRFPKNIQLNNLISKNTQI